jgi:hypothetical protein
MNEDPTKQNKQNVRIINKLNILYIGEVHIRVYLKFNQENLKQRDHLG